MARVWVVESKRLGPGVHASLRDWGMAGNCAYGTREEARRMATTLRRAIRRARRGAKDRLRVVSYVRESDASDEVLRAVAAGHAACDVADQALAARRREVYGG